MRNASDQPKIVEDVTRCTFVVSTELLNQFRLVAQGNNRTLSGELRQLIRDSVDRDAAHEGAA